MKNQILNMLLGLILVAVLTSETKAQSGEKVWSFGPELGVNFSKFGKDADETDYNTGLLMGGFVTYSIRNTHAFTVKVLYSQKGASDNDNNIKSHLNYIEIPVLARLFFNRDGDIRPNIFVGPSFGFLQSAKVKAGDGDYEDVSNFDNAYNTFDVGLGLGFGMNFRVSQGMYFIMDARYTYGLSDISKSNADVNNQGVALTAGLSFGLGN